MAVGEIGSFLLGPVAAAGAVMAIPAQSFLLKLVVFLVSWYMATSIGLRIVHFGYTPDKRTKVS